MSFFSLIAHTLWIQKTFAQNEFPYDIWNEAINIPNSEDVWNTLVANQSMDSNSLLTRLIESFRIDPFVDGNPNGATNYIAYIINILLGLATVVALILLLYGFYLMFFSKQEDWLAKAKKILIGVTIALVILGIARFIVALAFNIFTTVG